MPDKRLITIIPEKSTKNLKTWDACGQIGGLNPNLVPSVFSFIWGRGWLKPRRENQHGGRSSASACEENLVKKSHGNEGKCNLTHLWTLKSTPCSSIFLCSVYLVHEKKSRVWLSAAAWGRAATCHRGISLGSGRTRKWWQVSHDKK